THYSYVWLFNDPPFSMTANWAPNPFAGFFSDPATGFINTGFPKGMLLAQWLQYIGASTTYGQMTIQTLRHAFTGAVPPSLPWITVNDLFLGTVPMHYTFDTPVGVPPAQQCGRVLYDDFHVEDPSLTIGVASTTGYTFPTECAASPMTPQEKMLEFM